MVATEGSRGVLANLQRKGRQADEMFASLVSYMNAAQAIDRVRIATKPQELPAWL